MLLLLMVACHRPHVPTSYKQLNMLPKIYPDYADVTVPVNIAPLRFELLSEADEVVVRFATGHDELLTAGQKSRPNVDDWHQLLAKAQGGDITVEVYAESGGSWVRFKPFAIHVSTDSIDPWLCYRLISPSYVSYEELTINQRCIENFDERVVADNMLCSDESGGQCINCHSFQQYNPRRMQLHARQNYGGTLIAYDGELKKVNLRRDGMPGVAVYPAWHPTEQLIAYSCNTTMQAFHTVDIDKIEVFDSQSSLVLYDVQHDTVSIIDDQPNEMATFPTWSPDGSQLYYCSAHFEYAADTIDTEELLLRTRELKCNLYRRSFDVATHQFGERELVLAADSLPIAADAPQGDEPRRGMSATLPRISPDGRWLLFTMGEYGTFHIWHRDTDLWMMELGVRSEELGVRSDELGVRSEELGVRSEELGVGGEAHPLVECNSPCAESYHSWSSNGRWIVFSSRRHDGVFTRPFFAHINENGQGAKPFELPSEDPDYHLQLLKSYNVPELLRGPVTISPQAIASKLKE